MSPKLLFLSGSIRKESFNSKLIREAVALAKEAGAKVTLIDLKDFPMPIYNGDLEAESGLPESAKKLKKLFIEHTGFMIASPEYNSSISPLLKNSLDWISRKETPDEPGLIAFTGKVAGLVAASTGGFGGLRGLVPLRMMLSNIGVFVIPSQLAIPFADKAFDAEGKFVESKQRESLRGVVKQFIETAKKFA
ncbi:MAG: NAD(P)H-dependent oxidoreductase [Rickettsiales bacterium]|jgi:NAD(P)H-dependent FMN reductase|nr:NAD(P)H-dependent oxidoreductase [Rickettsiales bacterium]